MIIGSTANLAIQKVNKFSEDTVAPAVDEEVQAEADAGRAGDAEAEDRSMTENELAVRILDMSQNDASDVE